MKNLMKFVLSAALCGMFVACDDSGASASDDVSSSSEVIPSLSSSSHSELVSESTSSSSSENVDTESSQGDTSSSSLNASSSCHSELVSESTSSSSSSVDPEIPQGDVSSSSDASSSSTTIVDPSTVIKGTMTDARDGKVYKTVTIGEQTWMAENLNYAYNEKTAEDDSSSFCYNDEPDSCVKYGRLYLWSAAMDSAAVFGTTGKGCGYGWYCGASENIRGVCPEGWHLPSHSELSTLFAAVSGKSSAGTKLKSTSSWHDDGNGEDIYGFSVLPAGLRSNYGSFDYAGYRAHFWSSMEYGSSFAYLWYFYYNNAYVAEGCGSKNYAFSVRCVKD